MPTRLLITGSREFTDQAAVRGTLLTAAALTSTLDITLVHGAARGLDRMAATAAEQLGFATEAHPADWETHGKSAGYKRNQLMVDLGADLCIGFPMHSLVQSREGQGSKGTWMCIQLAAKAGIPTLVLWAGHLSGFNDAGKALLGEHQMLRILSPDAR